MAKASRIRALRASLDAVDPADAVRVNAPTSEPKQADKEAIAERLLRPFSDLEVAASSNKPRTDLVIGIDIGSTSTKIVVRLPYYGSGAAQPVPVPSWLRADNHPYYSRTLLWETKAGDYHLLPCASAAIYDQIKVDFLRVAESATIIDPEILRMTAFMALTIRQAAGWFQIAHPNLCSKFSFTPWINIGFPAAALERDGAQQLFRVCASAAGRLAVTGVPISGGNVFDELFVSTQYAPDPELEPLVEVYPELSGAIAGFASSTESRTEKYVLLDVGGLTLDCVFFSLNKDDASGSRYAVYAADICRYGAEIVKYWISTTDHAEAEAASALGNFFAETVLRAHDKIPRIYYGNREVREVPALLTGGGRQSAPHRNAPEWAQTHLANSTSAVRLPVTDLAPFRTDMDVPLLFGEDICRLLVASGLSRFRTEIPTWTTSKDVRDATPVMTRDFGDYFVGPEQT
jgi:hypothetical protein